MQFIVGAMAEPSNTTSKTESSSDSESTSSATTALSSIASTFAGVFQSEDDPKYDDAVNVGLYWDEWSRCIGSGYQSDSLYRHGKLDGCGRQWRDLKLAAEARLTQWRNPQRARDLIESTYYVKRTTISPTAGAIWELKEKPGWE